MPADIRGNVVIDLGACEPLMVHHVCRDLRLRCGLRRIVAMGDGDNLFAQIRIEDFRARQQ